LAFEDVRKDSDQRIESGLLGCEECGARFPIVNHVPRFVASDNYAASFGLEWTRHARTQYDSHSQQPLSQRRFFEETRWPADLSGEVIIEAGSGSGRFTEHAASTGATVLSFDYSAAVESNYVSNGWRENVLIVQADIYRIPFQEADRAFCFGVLQHTPDPDRAFRAIAGHVRPGGQVAADVYLKSLGRYFLQPKYWVRPVTRRMRPERLYRLTRSYVDLMWPIARRIRRIPKIGKTLNWKLLIGDYSDLIDSDQVLREWAHLDTFDMLSPAYDNPQTLRSVLKWGARAGLENFEACYGYNGIEIRGTRLSSGSASSADDRQPTPGQRAG
jgi:SAM-dependent methyltransferase